MHGRQTAGRQCLDGRRLELGLNGRRLELGLESRRLDGRRLGAGRLDANCWTADGSQSDRRDWTDD